MVTTPIKILIFLMVRSHWFQSTFILDQVITIYTCAKLNGTYSSLPFMAFIPYCVFWGSNHVLSGFLFCYTKHTKLLFLLIKQVFYCLHYTSSPSLYHVTDEAFTSALYFSTGIASSDTSVDIIYHFYACVILVAHILS